MSTGYQIVVCGSILTAPLYNPQLVDTGHRTGAEKRDAAAGRGRSLGRTRVVRSDRPGPAVVRCLRGEQSVAGEFGAQKPSCSR